MLHTFTSLVIGINTTTPSRLNNFDAENRLRPRNLAHNLKPFNKSHSLLPIVSIYTILALILSKQFNKMKLYDAQSAHTMALRLFILERGRLSLDVESVDMDTLQNRRSEYLKINSRGELPALVLDDGTLLTEVTALYEYFDEIATTGKSLFGSNAVERAETRMWLRRVDLEITGPLLSWVRNDPATIDLYQGNRIPIPEARVIEKVQINQALNRFNDEMEGKQWLCGDRFSAADVHMYGMIKRFVHSHAPWVAATGRKNFVAYFKRMDKREACVKSFDLFPSRLELP